MKKIEGIDEPMNSSERYLHAMTIRLDALCHMVSSLVEHIAQKESVTVVENKVEEKISAPRKKTSTKSTKG
jgi:hypothetical protein